MNPFMPLHTLMARRASARAMATLALAGLAAAFAPRTQAATSVDLWPFYESTNDSTVVMWPFYDHEGKFLMVFPFYYRTNEGKDHHIVWPIVKFSEGRLTRLAPVWYSQDADTFTIFP